MGLQWREQLSVGNDLIDSDHKYLIEIINLAEHSLMTKDSVALAATLDKLRKYAKTHFSREEAIATAAGYPLTAQLNHAHEALLVGLVQMAQEAGQEWSEAAGKRFSVFLRGWLIDHVIKEDLLMKPYLKKYSPTFDPR